MKIRTLALALFAMCCCALRSNASDTIRLVFVGDMMQHDAQILAAYDSTTQTYDYSDCFKLLSPLTQTADVSVCNFEVSLAGKPYKGYPSFSAPDEFLDAMTDAGFDVFLTANNHCIDKRKKGLERTIEQMRLRQLAQAGTYLDSLDRQQRYPLIINRKDAHIALLNYTYGTNGIKVTAPNVVNYTDTTQILTDIAAAQAQQADFIIACMHWGEEYKHQPNAQQKKLAKWLIDNGVDHVIGSHPHVVQPIEKIVAADGREHLVVYSLGNVISNQQQPGTTGGIAVTLTLYTNQPEVFDYTYEPFHVARPDKTSAPNYMVVPLSTPDSLIPDGEKDLLELFANETKQIIEP